MSTTITYKEAAEILGVDPQRIRAAVSREILTQVPTRGYIKFVYKEQVELFKGKPELSKHQLSPEEKVKWKEVAKDAMPVSVSTPAPLPYVQSPSITLLDRNTLAYMHETGMTVHVDTPAGPMSFQPALADNTTALDNMTVVLVLLGLVTLLVGHAINKPGIVQSAHTFLTAIGLARDEIINQQSKVIDALKSHPNETLQFKQVLEKEGILPRVA